MAAKETAPKKLYLLNTGLAEDYSTSAQEFVDLIEYEEGDEVAIYKLEKVVKIKTELVSNLK